MHSVTANKYIFAHFVQETAANDPTSLDSCYFRILACYIAIADGVVDELMRDL